MKRETWNVVALVAGAALLVGGAPWLIGQLKSLPASRLAARADQRIVTLEVGGMTCGGCAATVQSQLTALPGVSDAQVLYRQRRAYVVCEPGVTDTSLTGAVERAGPGFLAAVVTK
jgi:copper chaperone CopZ